MVFILDSYKTIDGESIAEFVEKRSRFIGHIKNVKTESEAMDFVNHIKSVHHDARHNVFAYITNNGDISRSSDDGEPSGTAGIPVLEVLKKNNLINTAIVVTRYFGGILLGGGGLVRAYSHTASLAVASSNVINMIQCENLKIVCNYSQFGKISALIAENQGKIDETEFLSDVFINFHLISEEIPFFEKKLKELTSGSVVCKKFGKNFYPF